MMSTKRAIFSCLFVLVISAFAGAKRQPRILGGKVAERGPHTFPYMVTLCRDARPPNYCGGAIISKYWVLTAAHCQLPRDKVIHVKVGKHSLSTFEDTEHVIEVAQFVIHGNYRTPFGENDIALLKLRDPLDFNEYVAPIALPKKGKHFHGKVIFTGWGLIANNQLPDELQKAVLEITDIEQCKLLDTILSSELSKISSRKMICTGPLTGEVSLCQGDSGGPLVKRRNNTNVLVGVASFTLDSCGQPYTASVFTKVSHYVDWINNVTKAYDFERL